MPGSPGTFCTTSPHISLATLTIGPGKPIFPDYLAVSFSSTDYVGHLFGPSSLETEDNILRLDRTLKELFVFVDRYVGLKNTLIVLSADHGSPEVPGYLNELGIEAQYVEPDKWDREPAIKALKEEFGIGKELIQTYYHPYIYLNQNAIREKGLDRAEVERAIAAELVKVQSEAFGVSSRVMSEGNLPDTELRSWLDRIYDGPGSATIWWFVNVTDNPELKEKVSELTNSLFADEGLSFKWSLSDFYKGIAGARKAFLHRIKSAALSHTGLFPLNP